MGSCSYLPMSTRSMGQHHSAVDTVNMSESKNEDKTVLPDRLGGGPYGLGDPDDQTLGKAEKEILIPQKMKAKAKVERCADGIRGFGECAKEQRFLMPFKCREVGRQTQKCLEAAYQDPAFVALCTQEYLRERSE